MVLVLGVVVLLLAVEVANFWRTPKYVGLDFHAYEAAARVGQQSGWAQIYDQVLVKAAERQLVPHQSTLRFISPQPVAWLAAALTPLPYWFAYAVWAALMFSALAFALAWSTSYRGLTRLVAVSVAIVPWWVLHAVYVGQVVPLIAASVLIAWRLLRENATSPPAWSSRWWSSSPKPRRLRPSLFWPPAATVPLRPVSRPPRQWPGQAS